MDESSFPVLEGPLRSAFALRWPVVDSWQGTMTADFGASCGHREYEDRAVLFFHSGLSFNFRSYLIYIWGQTRRPGSCSSERASSRARTASAPQAGALVMVRGGLFVPRKEGLPASPADLCHGTFFRKCRLSSQARWDSVLFANMV